MMWDREGGVSLKGDRDFAPPERKRYKKVWRVQQTSGEIARSLVTVPWKLLVRRGAKQTGGISEVWRKLTRY